MGHEHHNFHRSLIPHDFTYSLSARCPVVKSFIIVAFLLVFNSVLQRVGPKIQNPCSVIPIILHTKFVFKNGAVVEKKSNKMLSDDARHHTEPGCSRSSLYTEVS